MKQNNEKEILSASNHYPPPPLLERVFNLYILVFDWSNLMNPWGIEGLTPIDKWEAIATPLFCSSQPNNTKE